MGIQINGVGMFAFAVEVLIQIDHGQVTMVHALTNSCSISEDDVTTSMRSSSTTTLQWSREASDSKSSSIGSPGRKVMKGNSLSISLNKG